MRSLACLPLAAVVKAGKREEVRKEWRNKDSLAEESKWLIELLRLLWVTLLAVGGGTAGLILGERNLLHDAFTILP